MRKKIIITIFILTLIFIWGHSMLSANVSLKESNAVGGFLTSFFEFFVGAGNVTSRLIRKTAHVVEYAVLGSEVALMLVCRWIHEANEAEKMFKHMNLWVRAILSVAVSFAVAAIDETIQIFSEGRGPGFGDVLIDTAGATGGVLIVTLIYIIAKRREAEK